MCKICENRVKLSLLFYAMCFSLSLISLYYRKFVLSLIFSIIVPYLYIKYIIN